MKGLVEHIYEKLIIYPEHKVHEKLIINKDLVNVNSNNDIIKFLDSFKKTDTNNDDVFGFILNGNKDKIFNELSNVLDNIGTHIGFNGNIRDYVEQKHTVVVKATNCMWLMVRKEHQHSYVVINFGPDKFYDDKFLVHGYWASLISYDPGKWMNCYIIDNKIMLSIMKYVADNVFNSDGIHQIALDDWEQSIKRLEKEI